MVDKEVELYFEKKLEDLEREAAELRWKNMQLEDSNRELTRLNSVLRSYERQNEMLRSELARANAAWGKRPWEVVQKDANVYEIVPSRKLMGRETK